jgi:voltage-gated potassium channel
MLVQAMQDKVHIPLQTLLTNDEDEEIYFVNVPRLEQNWNYWELHTYLKERYDFLSFALQTDGGKVVINPAKDLVVGENFGIWLIAGSRPVGVEWRKNAGGGHG